MFLQQRIEAVFCLNQISCQRFGFAQLPCGLWWMGCWL